MSDDLDRPEPDEGSYSLVMPFVVVQSTGGPYDDAAFTAGWAAGAIDRTLHSLADEAAVWDLTFTVRTDLIPQMELIGMRHQFPVMRSAATEVSEWSSIIFARTDETGETT